jgi:hypothetical protein
VVVASPDEVLVPLGVGIGGLWLTGVGIAMLTNYRGLADWWARQPDNWRLRPRRDRPTRSGRSAATRARGTAILIFGLVNLALSLAAAVQAIL